MVQALGEQRLCQAWEHGEDFHLFIPCFECFGQTDAAAESLLVLPKRTWAAMWGRDSPGAGPGRALEAEQPVTGRGSWRELLGLGHLRSMEPSPLSCLGLLLAEVLQGGL